MAEKLSIRIALEGGAEVERQLADIGEAGKKAFAEIEQSASAAGGFKELDPKAVTKSLQDMGVTGAESIDKIQQAVKTAGRFEKLVLGAQAVENGFAAVGKAALAMAPVAGAAFSAITAAVLASAKATIAFAESINKINDQAIKLGVGVEQVDRFRAGLEQAGVSAESVGQILQSKLASEQGLQGLEAFIQSLERMPDSAARSKAAVEQFGAAGAELIRILQAGGRLTGFGGTQGLINPEDAQKATRLNQAINQLESAWSRLNSVQLAPALGAGINTLTAAVEVLGQRMSTLPATFSFLAQALFTPFQTAAQLITSITAKLLGLGTATQQTGQKLQQDVQMWTQWGSAATQSGQQATVAVQGVGAAAQTTGQQGVQMWTQWGTAAGEAATKAEAAKASLFGWNWDLIAAGKRVWDDLTAAVGGYVTKALEAIGLSDWNWDPIAAGIRVWNDLTTAAQKYYDLALKALGLRSSGPAPAGGDAPGKASGGLLGGRGSGTSDSNLAWVSRGEYIMPAAAVRQPGVLSFLEALRRSGRIPGFARGGVVGSSVAGGTESKLDMIIRMVSDQSAKIDTLIGIVQTLVSTLSSVVDSNKRIVDTAKEEQAKLRIEMKNGFASNYDIFNEVLSVMSIGPRSSDPGGGSFVPGGSWARGGLLGGRGTGTSDSNLAWLSRGEHIMPARAVSQPGVLAFLESLRRSGGNLSRVLDGMGRFALGGMVPRAIPAFAAGGLAGGGSHVTIQFPGLPAIGGLRASSDVVDQLHRAAALAQVRSGGRKPSRYS